jgi:polar amino acid transport system substrate-binding protein
LLALAAGIAVLASLAAGCGGHRAGGGSGATIAPPAAIRTSGKIVFCAGKAGGGTAVAGPEREIAEAVAGLMGVEAEIGDAGSKDAAAALSSGRCDAIVDAATDRQIKAGTIDLVPYLRVGLLVVIKRGNPERIGAGLGKLTGKKVAVLAGARADDVLAAENRRLSKRGQGLVTNAWSVTCPTENDVLTKYLAKERAPIAVRPYASDRDALQALDEGKVDAFLVDAALAATYVHEAGEDLKPAGRQLRARSIGFAILERDRLGPAMAAAVAELYTSGRIKAILADWNLADSALLN